MLYFFLSYARGDEDELVHRFYEDLSADVRLLAGKPSDEAVGFVDRTIQVGEQWPQRVAEALSSCGSFLALMTPRYFRSEPCGKEWHLFRERALASTESSLLKPLMWIPTPPTKMHPVAEPIQYYSEALGETYRRLGVRQLMRLMRYQDDYRSLVFELARQIVEGVEQQPVPPGLVQLGFHEAPSAFHAPVPLVDELAVIGEAPQPLLVHLVVAASSRREMSAVRNDVAAYGDRPAEWSPFRPPMPEPLAEYARSIAADHSFESRIADLDELAGRADLTGRGNQILVLLVDAWVTRLDDAKQVLRAHNTRTGQVEVPTAVLIPNSRDDMETRRHWPGLSRACREILDRLARDDQLYRSDITTHRHFELELPGVLEVARNRLYRRGPAKRSPGPAVNPQPPRIDGPSADQEEELP